MNGKGCFRWPRRVALASVVSVLLLFGAMTEMQADDKGPVSFSVNGPTDPHYDGMFPPGLPGVFNPPWAPPPVPPGAGPYPPVRINAVPMAEGIATFRPGDVNDYYTWPLGPIRSEAEIFQSEPDSSLSGIPAGPPAGTNNQILKAIAIGLQDPYSAGPIPGNVNALTFGEDFFNGNEEPIPGEDPPVSEYWAFRDMFGGFTEPVVAGGGLPITFYFSVDPWAIGVGGTAVQNEATLGGLLSLPAGPPGSADVDLLWPPGGSGPWESDGEAAGDVYAADPITTPGTNTLDHDDSTMALLAPRTTATHNMEDDLDALEHVGDNTIWDPSGGITPGEPGNTHDRVDPTGGGTGMPGINGGTHPPDLGDPTNPNHDPNNMNPIIFSVDRGTYGAPGSAVASQVLSFVEGASGDLFIAVTILDQWGFWTTTNMLLIDEGQLGLMPHDDLDAVILCLGIAPDDLMMRIEYAAWNFNPDAPQGSQGYGFTQPLVQGPGEAHVGFSVDTASIGLLWSAVDFECRVDGLGIAAANPPGSGVMEQAGDIFYSDLQPVPGQLNADPGTGLLYGQNYLWFEEGTIGLDPGAWTLMAGGPSGVLSDLPDELNALDSLRSPGQPKCNPDLDFDGDVDGKDFLTFSVCYNGPLKPPSAACPNTNADLDFDGDVDGIDFLTFSVCYNGALNPMRPNPPCPCK